MHCRLSTGTKNHNQTLIQIRTYLQGTFGSQNMTFFWVTMILVQSFHCRLAVTNLRRTCGAHKVGSGMEPLTTCLRGPSPLLIGPTHRWQLEHDFRKYKSCTGFYNTAMTKFQSLYLKFQTSAMVKYDMQFIYCLLFNTTISLM